MAGSEWDAGMKYNEAAKLLIWSGKHLMVWEPLIGMDYGTVRSVPSTIIERWGCHTVGYHIEVWIRMAALSQMQQHFLFISFIYNLFLQE